MFDPNYLQDIPTKLSAFWKSCQDCKLSICQTELGFPASKLVLCSVFSVSNDSSPHFRLKTLDSPVYSTSFQGPGLFVSASSPTPLCLSSGPQNLYLGMLQSPPNSPSPVLTHVPPSHHTHCYYQFHLLVSDLLTHPTLLKTSHSFNLLTAVVSYVVPRMKSCPETPVCQLDKSRLFWSHQERILDRCPSVFTTPELSRRDFE